MIPQYYEQYFSREGILVPLEKFAHGFFCDNKKGDVSVKGGSYSVPIKRESLDCLLMIPENNSEQIVVIPDKQSRGFNFNYLFADYLTQRHIPCLLVPMPYCGERKEEHQTKYSIKAIQMFLDETKLVIDKLQKDFPTHRIDILGVSWGGILACLAAQKDERIIKQVYIMAGANKNLLKETSHRAKETLVYIKEYDPSEQATRKDSENVFMVNGIYDTVLGFNSAEKLNEALGKPRIKWIYTGHVDPGIIFFISGVLKSSYKHLRLE